MYSSSPATTEAFENGILYELLKKSLPSPIAIVVFALLSIGKKIKNNPIISAILIYGIYRIFKEIAEINRNKAIKGSKK